MTGYQHSVKRRFSAIAHKWPMAAVIPLVPTCFFFGLLCFVHRISQFITQIETILRYLLAQYIFYCLSGVQHARNTIVREHVWLDFYEHVIRHE